MKKLTIHDVLQLKGKRQLTEIWTDSIEEAIAAQAAGIDMIVTSSLAVRKVRQAAPYVFLMGAPVPFSVLLPSNEAAICAAQGPMDDGADGVYCGCHNMERVEAIASVQIPVFGHVGYVPWLSHWNGGPRSYGKSAPDAVRIFKHVKQYEAAGAVGVEMELVPHRVAAEISKRTKICVISMGSGNGCDVQYLFATDILGTNRGHVPRHAKQYANLRVEYDRIQKLMTDAFTQFKDEVANGSYPERRHSLEVTESEFSQFVNELDR